jgi:hypothetical protein
MQMQLGGQLRTLKFNMAAVDAFWEKVNFERVNSSSIYASIYAGLIGNDVAKGVQISEFDYEQVTDWVDELSIAPGGDEKIKEVCDLFADSAFYKKKLEQIQAKVRQAAGESEKKSLSDPT